MEIKQAKSTDLVEILYLPKVCKSTLNDTEPFEYREMKFQTADAKPLYL